MGTSLLAFSLRSQMAEIKTESKGFILTCFIVLGLIAGLLLAVIIYFNQLKSDNIPSDTEITSMLVICGIFFALAIVLWIWAAIRFFVKPKQLEEWGAKVSKKAGETAGMYESEKLRDPEGYAKRKALEKEQKAAQLELDKKRRIQEIEISTTKKKSGLTKKQGQ